MWRAFQLAAPWPRSWVPPIPNFTPRQAFTPASPMGPPPTWLLHLLPCAAPRVQQRRRKRRVISTVRMAAVAPLFFTVRPIKGYIRRTPKRFLPKLAPVSPTLHRRHNMTAPREAAFTLGP